MLVVFSKYPYLVFFQKLTTNLLVNSLSTVTA